MVWLNVLLLATILFGAPMALLVGDWRGHYLDDKEEAPRE